MAMIFLILSFLFYCPPASASEIVNAVRAKNYQRVSDIYRDHMSKDYTRKELILISYSLRKLGFFRQDIRLNVRLVKKNFLKEHRKLMSQIKNSETVDPDNYPDALKVHYWNLFTSYGQILKGYDQNSALVEKDHKYFALYSKILSELEFREERVDRYNDDIIAHRQYLVDKIYRFKASMSIQYVSWQQDGTLKSITDGDANLIITNRGLCGGGDIGIENYLFHFYLDGCFLYGAGGVKNTSSATVNNYQQSGVPAYGFKGGPGASIIVSSSKSRIGIRVPIIYSIQELTAPTIPGYSIEESSPISIVTSIYSRWQFDNWYFQTEFGKYTTQEQTFWGLGIGKEF